MKKENRFNIGDKVFAKVKGYPPWPAMVVEENGKKYKVKFYGTGELGQIKVEDLSYYSKNKHKLLKPSKRKDFNDSVQEIEEAIKACGTDGSPDHENDRSEDSVSTDSLSTSIDFTKKRKRSASFARNLDDSSSTKVKKEKRSASVAKNIDDSTLVKLKKEKATFTGGSRSASPTSSSIDEEKNGIDVDIKKIKSKGIISTQKKTIRDSSDKNDLKSDEADVELDKTKTITAEKTTEFVEKSTSKDLTPDKKMQPIEKISVKDYVVEKELEAFIAFGEYVEKHEEIYSKLPVEERWDSAIQNFPFFFGKRSIGIKLHKIWPLKDFKNEYERAIYDKIVSQNALESKNSFKYEQLKESPDMYLENLEISEDDLNKLFNEKVVAMKEEILEKLKIEGSLLQIDSKIKSCLNLDKAEPKEAIVLLSEVLTLNLNSTMLKKHVHVVEMIRRLRKYVGNIERWSLTDEEKKTFRKDAEEVRKTALKVYVKFMQIVGKPPGADTFWDAFNNIATKFREETKDLSEGEFYVLTCEPHSRRNFMNNYFIKDMSLNVPSQNNVTKDTDTDNKSKSEQRA